MEDYSTVIWVVAIFAAMLFNATSQARKKAKKQAHETQKHTQHEAWPSWDTQSADEMRHPDSQESVSGAETDRLRPAMQQPAPTPGFGEVARKTADFKSSGRHAGRKNTSDGQSPREEILHEEHAAGDRHTTEEAVTEITEDFNLRKAVIYSEILKPKFNEE